MARFSVLVRLVLFAQPDDAGRRLRAVSAAGRLGRRRQFGDQRIPYGPANPQRDQATPAA